MMNNSILSSTFKRRSRGVRRILFFVGGVLLFLYIVFPHHILNGIHRIVAPFSTLQNHTEKLLGATQNAHLTRSELFISLNEKNEEIKRLREALAAYEAFSEIPKNASPLITRPSFTRDGSFLVQLAIDEDTIVFTSTGLIVGIAEQVTPTKARVVPFTSPWKTATYSFNAFTGDGVGRGGDVVIEAPNDISITKGDTISLIYDEKSFPFGTVAGIEEIPGKVYSTIHLQPFVNIHTITHIFK